MYSVIGPEPKFMPQLIGEMDLIMSVAGMNWTMPSLDGWDNSNMAMYSGDFETMARVERLHHEKALELKVKRVVMGECGHAFRGAVYDGPRWLGWKRSTRGWLRVARSSFTTTTPGRAPAGLSTSSSPIDRKHPCRCPTRTGPP